MPAANSTLARLLEAKRHSDRRDYGAKVEILRQLIRQDPDSWKIDSELPGGIVGLTHGGTNFKIHAPAASLPGEVTLARLDPQIDLEDEKRRWRTRPPLEALVDAAGDETLDLKKAAAEFPLSDAGIYYQPLEERVHLYAPGDDLPALERHFVKRGFAVTVHADQTLPENFFAETWVTIKRAYSPALRAFTDLTGFTPGPVNRWYGGPNPIAGTLLGGLAGAGLGYGMGAASEALANSTGIKLLRNKRLRKTLGLIGGLAGAVPGAIWGAQSMYRHGPAGLVSSYPGINDDPRELPTTNSPGDGTEKPASVRDPEEEALREPLVLLQALVPEELWPGLTMKVAAFGDGGGDAPVKVDVDSFGRAIWSPEDPFTPPDIRAAATGLVDAAAMYRGGSSIVTPLDIGRVAVGMGSGLVSGLVTGKVLGALAGLSPDAQQTLQRAGTWYGALRAVVPGLFGG